MIFNNADNIMYGDKEVDRVFYGKNLVWERGGFYWISDRQTQSICGYKGVPTSPVCYLNWNQKPTNVSRPFPSYKLNTSPYKLKNIFGDIYDYKYLITTRFDKAYTYSLTSANSHRDIFAKTNIMINYNNLEDKSYCTEIGDDVFLYGEVNSIVFNNCTINSIGHSAFADFTSYTYGELMLGDSNNSIIIKDQAFWDCHWEFKISFNNEHINLGRYVFSGSDVKEVVFPTQISPMPIKKSTFCECDKLGKINLPNGITSINNHAFEGCSSLEEIIIPNTVSKIGDWAFGWCSSLKNIVIPDTVTSIGRYIFQSCSSLETATILDGVAEIGYGMFYLCRNLTSATIPNSVTSIGVDAFYGCTSLASITIPDSVTTIRDYAFENCTSLANVTIGNGVTSIGGRAFGECSNLSDIYYTGTEEQWNAITKGEDWLYGTSGNVTIHYNS